MNVYRGTPEEDALVAVWWNQMAMDGDLERTFAAGARTLSGLFGVIAPFPAKALLYEHDDRGMWACFWAEPFLSGLCLGAWVRPDRRGRRGLMAFLEALDEYLKHAPVIVGITKQASLVRLHTRLGYRVLGEIPHLFDGETAIVLTLDREHLTPVLARFRRASVAEEVV